MFTLFRFLPLIIGDFIPVMDDTWLFLLDYLYLISYLMSPAFLEADYQVRGVLIRKFCLNNFFSAKKLKKKKLKLLFRATFGCLQGDVSSRVHNLQAAQIDP